LERTINVFGGNEQINEIQIGNIPFEELNKIVPPPLGDSLLHDGCNLDAAQLEILNKYLGEKIVVDLNNYSYVPRLWRYL